MRTTGGGAGAAAVAERKFYLHFTINLPTDKGNHGRGREGQQAGPPVIICHYKTTQQKGENPIISWAQEGWDCALQSCSWLTNMLMNILKKDMDFPLGK